MFDHNHYVPILKWKRGERKALLNLDSIHKKVITPLIEIQPVPFNHVSGEFSKSLDEHLANIGQEVNEAWDKDKPIFVDLNTLYDNGDFEDVNLQSGQHPLEFIIDEIESKGIPAIPVTGIHRFPLFNNAVKKVIEKYNRGLCIRLEESDLSDIHALKSEIDNLIDFLGVDKSSLDLVLDYKQILPQQEQHHITKVTLTLVQLPYLQEWRTLTLASTAYPKKLNQIPTNSNGSLPRTEWSVYQTLRGYGLARIPTFGDYTITHPDFVNLDPRVINMAAGIKYTAGNETLIFRGIGVKNNGFSQMIQLCIDVTNHFKYYGRTFSYGDQYIYDCANQLCNTGNAESWVIVGVNHHLSVVSSDVSNLRVSSTVGSP